MQLSTNLILLFILSSCASQKIWTIKKQADSGIIATTKKLPSYSKLIRKKIPCYPYRILDIQQKSHYVEKVYRNYLSSSPATVGTASSLHDPLNNNTGSAIASSTPIFNKKKETWYEYKYSCKADKTK